MNNLEIIKLQQTRMGLLEAIKKEEARLPTMTRAARKASKARLVEAHGLVYRITRLIREAQA